MNINRRIQQLLSSVAILFIVGSCNIINPEEQVPGYIYIDDFTLSTSLESQGYPSSKITDAWVYSNNIFIGAFELPATIPLMDTGLTDIIIYPGIKENGISGVSMIYPFYNAETVTRTLVPGETDTIFPATDYKPSAAISFILLERFESTNTFEGYETEVALTTTTDPELVFEGNRSAFTTMTPDLDTFRVVSSVPIAFPGSDKRLFLELDYKCDLPFNVWVRCNTIGQPVWDEVLTVTEKEDWNKIYINLNPSLQFFAQYQPETIQLEFRAYNTTGDTAQIFFDNVKLIRDK